jgi:hypothetical protein
MVTYSFTVMFSLERSVERAFSVSSADAFSVSSADKNVVCVNYYKAESTTFERD